MYCFPLQRNGEIAVCGVSVPLVGLCTITDPVQELESLMQTAMNAEKQKQGGVQKQIQGLMDNLHKMEAQQKSLQSLHAVVQQQRKTLEARSHFCLCSFAAYRSEGGWGGSVERQQSLLM